ncbi:MAG: NADH-quinone oxidoreductase subunit N [SAR202 cluster bacterium]|nr:NADH-quinone oxidoreductase subunit N [SAR202 cluster bacterium]
MTSHDVWLLSPELSVAGIALLLVIADLAVKRKGFLPGLAVIGLAVPLGLSIALWFELNNDGLAASDGVFGTLVVDKFSLFFKFLFVGVAAIIVLISADYVKKFQRFQAEYYALVLFSTVGMMLLASTTELITIFIALELTALPIAALAAFLRDSRSSESGMKFLILSAISSAVLLYGMVIVYGFTGSTVLEDIAGQLNTSGLDAGTPFGGNSLLFGIVLIIAGFGFKIASVPFQMWAPDVYEGSPTPVTAYLSVASKAAGFAVILRVFYVAFPMEVLSLDWSAVFAVLAGLSMTLGNLVAIRQDNIKRMLAYSTVAHAGYLMVGLAAIAARAPAADATSGPSAVLFYLGGYAATNMAAFAAIIAISNRIGSDQINDFAGMSRRAPYLAAVLGFSMVSLIGLPPTVGFMTKIYLFGAAVDSNLDWLVVLGVLNSVISAYYYLRVVRVMYLSPPATEERVSTGLNIRLAMLAAFAGVVFFGIYPTPLLRLAKTAADVLL